MFHHPAWKQHVWLGSTTAWVKQRETGFYGPQSLFGAAQAHEKVEIKSETPQHPEESGAVVKIKQSLVQEAWISNKL